MSTLMNYPAAARVLGIPLGTLYCWVSRKAIPHVRLGPRLVRFDEEELRNWLNSKRVRVAQDEASE